MESNNIIELVKVLVVLIVLIAIGLSVMNSVETNTEEKTKESEQYLIDLFNKNMVFPKLMEALNNKVSDVYIKDYWGYNVHIHMNTTTFFKEKEIRDKYINNIILKYFN